MLRWYLDQIVNQMETHVFQFDNYIRQIRNMYPDIHIPILNDLHHEYEHHYYRSNSIPFLISIEEAQTPSQSLNKQDHLPL